MENLNAEQVKYCLVQDIECGCGMYREVDVTDLKRALALIESQDLRIKELTEENANLHASCTELERFRSSLNDECAKVKADTVRKLTEMIKKYFPYYDADSGLYVVLDQIEKKMLEGIK